MTPFAKLWRHKVQFGWKLEVSDYIHGGETDWITGWTNEKGKNFCFICFRCSKELVGVCKIFHWKSLPVSVQCHLERHFSDSAVSLYLSPPVSKNWCYFLTVSELCIWWEGMCVFLSQETQSSLDAPGDLWSSEEVTDRKSQNWPAVTIFCCQQPSGCDVLLLNFKITDLAWGTFSLCGSQIYRIDDFLRLLGQVDSCIYLPEWVSRNGSRGGGSTGPRGPSNPVCQSYVAPSIAIRMSLCVSLFRGYSP